VIRSIAISLAAFALGTAVAAALGASSLGVALTFGQIAFAAAVTWEMVRR
jgi:hypothetical protein